MKVTNIQLAIKVYTVDLINLIDLTVNARVIQLDVKLKNLKFLSNEIPFCVYIRVLHLKNFLSRRRKIFSEKLIFYCCCACRNKKYAGPV